MQSMEFSRPEYWSGQLFPSPGDLPNPGIKPRSPTLQVDSLPAEPQGKPFVHKRGPLFFVSTFVPGVIIILFNICIARHSLKKFMHIILFDFSAPLLSLDP